MKNLDQALEVQKNSGKRLGAVLIENKFITEMQLIDTLKMQLGVDFIDLNNEKIDPTMAKYIPKNIAKQYRIIPVKVEGDRLWIAMEDPLNFRALNLPRKYPRRESLR
jgi:type IV pilus assembly protein PilB